MATAFKLKWTLFGVGTVLSTISTVFGCVVKSGYITEFNWAYYRWANILLVALWFAEVTLAMYHGLKLSGDVFCFVVSIFMMGLSVALVQFAGIREDLKHDRNTKYMHQIPTEEIMEATGWDGAGTGVTKVVHVYVYDDDDAGIEVVAHRFGFEVKAISKDHPQPELLIGDIIMSVASQLLDGLSEEDQMEVWQDHLYDGCELTVFRKGMSKCKRCECTGHDADSCDVDIGLYCSVCFMYGHTRATCTKESEDADAAVDIERSLSLSTAKALLCRSESFGSEDPIILSGDDTESVSDFLNSPKKPDAGGKFKSITSFDSDETEV